VKEVRRRPRGAFVSFTSGPQNKARRLSSVRYAASKSRARNAGAGCWGPGKPQARLVRVKPVRSRPDPNAAMRATAFPPARNPV